MLSLTYGRLPAREAFDEAFYKVVTDGYGFKINLGASDSRATDGFRLGDGNWNADELWAAIVEIVEFDGDDVADISLPFGVTRKDYSRQDEALDLVASILGILGFEWL